MRSTGHLLAAVLLTALIPGCKRHAGGPAEEPGGPPGPGHGHGPGAESKDMSFPVEVAKVEARRVEYAVTAVGSVEPYERVQVTARVAGVVERVRFREGDSVNPGRVLVEIEPQRFRVALTSAQAALAKAETSQTDADTGLKRREQAVAQHPGLIPGEEVENFRTKSNLAAAELAQARAAVETAQLNLRDAHLRAPIAGMIETKSVETGQYVQPGTVLATLLRRDPLLLRFKVPEGDAARLQRGMIARFRVRTDQGQYTAKLEHVAQAADDASRMVSIVAEVDAGQAGNALRAGAFAEVSIAVGAAVDAPVIPEIAIRPSESGFLAYVVEGGIVKQRTLVLGMRTADGKVEVRSGLVPGERLVVRGAEALRDGAKVKVVDGDGAEPDKRAPGSTLNGAGPRAAREDAVPATRTAR